MNNIFVLHEPVLNPLTTRLLTILPSRQLGRSEQLRYPLDSATFPIRIYPIGEDAAGGRKGGRFQSPKETTRSFLLLVIYIYNGLQRTSDGLQSTY